MDILNLFVPFYLPILNKMSTLALLIATTFVAVVSGFILRKSILFILMYFGMILISLNEVRDLNTCKGYSA